MSDQTYTGTKLFVVTTYFYPQNGGVAHHTYHLYKQILQDYPEYAVTIVASGTRNSAITTERIEGMTIYRLPYWLKWSNTPIHPGWVRMLRQIIANEKPDAICVHTPVPYLADSAVKAAGKLPVILKYHHAGSMKKGSLLIDIPIGLYEATIFRWMLQRAEVVIAASEYVKRTFLERFADNVHVVTPGVYSEQFTTEEKQAQNQILFVANLTYAERYKGLEYLLQALPHVREKIPDVTLTVVGGGDDLGYYQNLSDKLHLRNFVRFHGSLPHGDTLKHFQQSNVFVLPSLLESCPNVLLEAMAASLPVIGTESTGIVDIIAPGVNGLLFPPKNSHALADALITILTDTKLAQQMGAHGRRLVESNYTWKQKAAQTVEIINNTV
jgi:rhamnosyl/mannosyltransferase